MANTFGPIDNPLPNYGDLQTGGLLKFLSNFVNLFITVAGLFAFINLIIAGFQYISSGGDPKLTQAAWGKINMSLIGLVIIVGSFALAGIMGKILFGNWNAILSPQIVGP